jgi:aminoglycoside phosphotransferase (APT) family kinase protein
VKDFHDWFTFQYKRHIPSPETIPEPYRKDLPDDSDIVFTHGDLHRSNIIVSTSTPRILALVDWEQSAWLPAYWEDCKARWTCTYSDEWAVKYLPLILDEHVSTWEAWNYYSDPVGG